MTHARPALYLFLVAAALILLSQTGCISGTTEKLVTFVNPESVTCTETVDIKNPDCVSILDRIIPSAYAISTFPHMSVVMMSSAAASNAARQARERERKRKSCADSPLVAVCVKWLVSGGYQR